MTAFELRTADGRLLSRALARAERGQKITAFLLALPLIAFISSGVRFPPSSVLDLLLSQLPALVLGWLARWSVPFSPWPLGLLVELREWLPAPQIRNSP